MEELYKVWENIKNKTKNEYDMTDAAYRTFINPLVIDSIEGNTVYIMIPFEEDEGIGIDYYSKKYKTPLEVAMEELTGNQYSIVFINHISLSKDTIKPVSSYYNVSNLNDKYTFETFIVGKNNRFAHSAALAVAENPGMEFNPLFLYGNSGVGKTHLMHAIGNYILKIDPTKKVLYSTSEAFTNEVIKNIRENSTYKLREKYRNVDCLLLDDIQFLINKEATQDEFFNTFNELQSENKAIVLSSDKQPKDIEEISERLRTRFQQGLTASIEAPDYETRVAILQRYSDINNIYLSNEIIDYIATNIKNNIRELEGAFNKLKALHINNIDLNMEVVKSSVSEYVTVSENKKLSMKEIIDVVCNYYNIPVEEINSTKRDHSITHPRQVATWLCRNLTDNSQTAVGKAVGNRDHSTVINSINKINIELSSNSETKKEIEDIKKILEKR